ncbi:50S ribosomal protein L3 [Dehalococcoidia bacterium]|nr:50S ribosomal protein L3 [Dehalococcoidia bacterium]
MVLGIIGKKIGMTQFFREDGRAEAVTIVEAGPCVVTQVKTATKDGYEAVQLGFGETRRLIKPLAGHQGHLARSSKFRYLREFPLEDTGEVQVGHSVDASLFQAGDIVNVMGTSKGRGFAGGIKRHGFAGGPKTHGQSDRHRAPGSIGAGTTPGRVFKGKKMAGHMGNARVTDRGLEVLQSDSERNLIIIRGAVPGPNGGLLTIRKAIKGRRLKGIV